MAERRPNGRVASTPAAPCDSSRGSTVSACRPLRLILRLSHWQHAAKSFPDVHEKTVSFLSKGALITLGQSDEGDEPPTTNASYLAEATSKRAILHHRRHRAAHTPRGARRLEARFETLAEGRASSSSEEAVATTGALSGLDGAAAAYALVANGTSLSRARQAAFSRKGINQAMGAVRAKILHEGLCGVRRGSPACVGAWCMSRYWGNAH